MEIENLSENEVIDKPIKLKMENKLMGTQFSQELCKQGINLSAKTYIQIKNLY